MKIALIGYGKMGKEIEQMAISRNHTIVMKVDADNASAFSLDYLKQVDVAIEFSTPGSAVNNIYKCFDAGIPVVSGTTGWLDKFEEVKHNCIANKQTLFYASNYSIGVNLFFKLNKYLAKMMNNYPQYSVSMKEIHHVHKLDAPSGTAITLANQIISEQKKLEKWVNSESEKKNELSIISERTDEVPGTHIVNYNSLEDEISIIHKANNRKGFALGAILAAEWVIGRKGVFSMDDLLDDNYL